MLVRRYNGLLQFSFPKSKAWENVADNPQVYLNLASRRGLIDYLNNCLLGDSPDVRAIQFHPFNGSAMLYTFGKSSVELFPPSEPLD